jgi:hypothetical protein
MDTELSKKPRDEWAYIITQWVIGRNAVRDRDILISNWLDGISLERLAEKYEITPRQTSRIVIKRAQELINVMPVQDFIKMS